MTAIAYHGRRRSILKTNRLSYPRFRYCRPLHAFFQEQVVYTVHQGLPGSFNDVLGNPYRTPLITLVSGVNQDPDLGGRTVVAIQDPELPPGKLR